MRRFLLLGAFAVSSIVSGVVEATPPTTRPLAPTTPAEPRRLPTMVDPAKPAFLPKFARVNNPPSGQFEERKYASQYTAPTPIYGYGYYAGYGCGYGVGVGYAGGCEWSGGSPAY